MDIPQWQKLAAEGKLKEAIHLFIEEQHDVSFAELTSGFAAFTNVDGDCTITHRGNPSIMLWQSLSDTFASALLELLREEKIFLHPADILVYYHGGQVPRMPVAKRNIHYKTEHWLPTLLKAIPFDPQTGKGRLGK